MNHEMSVSIDGVNHAAHREGNVIVINCGIPFVGYQMVGNPSADDCKGCEPKPFKVHWRSGTGNDDLDKENGAGQYMKPTVYAFPTDAERRAFLVGVNETVEAMDGWVDAWVSVELAEEVPPKHEGYDEASEFLLGLADLSHDVAALRITEWLDATPEGNGRLLPLVQVARDIRKRGAGPHHEKLLNLFDSVKDALLD